MAALKLCRERPPGDRRAAGSPWALNFKFELNLKARGGPDQGRRGLGALAASGRLVSAGWHEAHGRDQAGPGPGPRGPLPVMPLSVAFAATGRAFETWKRGS